MNINQIKGRIAQAKGQVKQVTGRIVGNRKLEQQGKIEKIDGEAKSAYWDVKENIKDST